MDTNKSLGNKVKNLRMDARLSQKDAAKKLDCSPALLNMIESGRKPMSLEMAFRFEMLCQDTLRQVSSAIIQEAYKAAGGKGPAPASSLNHAFDLDPKPGAGPKPLTLSIRAEDLRGSLVRIE